MEVRNRHEDKIPEYGSDSKLLLNIYSNELGVIMNVDHNVSKHETLNMISKYELSKRIKDEIQTEFSWQQLIFNRFKNKINLNEKEINEELNEIIKIQQGINEYKLAEIEISSNIIISPFLALLERTDRRANCRIFFDIFL